MEIKVIYLPEAYDFLKNINETARKKILFNVKKVRLGVKDIEKADLARKNYFDNK